MPTLDPDQPDPPGTDRHPTHLPSSWDGHPPDRPDRLFFRGPPHDTPVDDDWDEELRPLQPPQPPERELHEQMSVDTINRLAAVFADKLRAWGYRVRGDMVFPVDRLLIVHASDPGRYAESGLASETGLTFGVHDSVGPGMYLYFIANRGLRIPDLPTVAPKAGVRLYTALQPDTGVPAPFSMDDNDRLYLPTPPSDVLAGHRLEVMSYAMADLLREAAR